MTANEVIIGVQIGMGVSYFSFVLGYFLRKKNPSAHKILGISGTVFNLATAVFLVVQARIFGVEIVSTFPIIIFNIHRAIATLVIILMLFMAYWGITKNRKMHIRFHKIFLAGYTIVYVSGWVLF